MRADKHRQLFLWLVGIVQVEYIDPLGIYRIASM